MAHSIFRFSRRGLVSAVFVLALVGCEAFQPKEDPKPTAGPEPVPMVPATPAKKVEPEKVSNLPKKRVLVLHWINRSEYDAPGALDRLERRLAEKLAQIEDVQPVPEREVDGSSAFFSLSGSDYNLPVAYKQTKVQGLAGFITGTLEAIRFEEDSEGGGLFSLKRMRTLATIRLDLHDSLLGRVVYSRTSTEALDEERAEVLSQRTPENEKEHIAMASEKALAAILPDLAQAMERIAWTGRIAKVEWNRYYITGGLATGIKPGQLLRVFTESEPIEDPMTGRMMGIPPGRFKGLLKVTELFGSDAAVAIVHSGAGFREADRVDVEPVTDAERNRP